MVADSPLKECSADTVTDEGSDLVTDVIERLKGGLLAGKGTSTEVSLAPEKKLANPSLFPGKPFDMSLPDQLRVCCNDVRLAHALSSQRRVSPLSEASRVGLM